MAAQLMRCYFPMQYPIETRLDDAEFAVLDTETTGMFSDHCRIMDIGILIVKNGTITQTYETLVDPKQEIPYFITKYTKLTSRDLLGAPVFEKVHLDIFKLLHNRVFVAHNAAFDYPFVKKEFRRLGINYKAPQLCTVKLTKRLYPHLPHANLDTVSEYFNINIEARHRAFPDAKATAEIFCKMLVEARERYNAKTVKDLMSLQYFKVIKHEDGDTQQGLF